MGSSKKHKKESKKKKHKSRSRSPLTPGAERPRKHHKKHRKRERERSPDVEEVPVDSHLQVSENGDESSGNDEQYQRDRGTHEEVRAEKQKDQRKDNDEDKSYREEAKSHKEDRSHRQDTRTHREDDDSQREERRSQKEDARPQKEDGRSQREDDRSQRESPREEMRVQKEKDPSPAAASSSYTESLSIEETNRLRAKLGLKPLQVQEKTADDGKITDDLGEFYHKPAANISEQKKTEKLKERLKERKERREIEKRLKTSTLVDDSDDEDASAWVVKSRKLQKDKEDAAKRAAALDEMDAEFGVGALVAAEEQETRARSYTGAHLTGLRVAHDTDDLGEEREVVLTLADKNVLDEDKEDVLINVNIADDERYRKAVKDRIKAAAGYRAYEDAEDIEAAALGQVRPVLAKYDEEIERAGTGAGGAAGDRGFVIGDDDALEARRFRQTMIKERLAGAGQKRLESLAFPSLRIASDYLSEKEMEAKFKKPKKKGKMRKKPKSEPIDVDEYDPSTAPLDTDDTEVKVGALADVKVDEEEELEPDSELQVALARARRLHQARDIASKIPKVEDIARRVKEEAASEMEAESAPAPGGAAMVLDATAEFCRTLGDIPTYGQAGNRDTHLDIMDIEADIVEPERGDAEPGGGGAGAWSRVDTLADKPADITSSDACGLEAEPALGGGVGGALRVALSKGYLERAAPQPPARLHTQAHLLEARHYSIEDKAYQDDDKYSRRGGGGGGGGDRYAGPLQDFREKSNFKPNIKLEYADDEGRPLCPKEAFRYLSHKFHGKGPGKNKQEKRLKKQLQEGLMKKMSSTDTPLNTLAMLQDKQKETHSPFIVLSGAKTKTTK